MSIDIIAETDSFRLIRRNGTKGETDRVFAVVESRNGKVWSLETHGPRHCAEDNETGMEKVVPPEGWQSAAMAKATFDEVASEGEIYPKVIW